MVLLADNKNTKNIKNTHWFKMSLSFILAYFKPHWHNQTVWEIFRNIAQSQGYLGKSNNTLQNWYLSFSFSFMITCMQKSNKIQSAFTFSKLTIETLEQRVEYVQS